MRTKMQINNYVYMKHFELAAMWMITYAAEYKYT